MKVLLIGSSGFIGREIRLQLKLLGNEVVEFNKTDSNPLGYMNEMALAEIFSNHNFDCVISTAWATSHSTYRDSDENLQHQAATENLALQAKRYSVPIFVALGSAAEYGYKNFAATSLLSSLKSVDNYSRAKVSTFHSLTKIFDSTSTLLIWPRIFQPYGRGQDSNRFLPTLISQLASHVAPKINHPEHVYDWINVSDVAEAILYSIVNRVGGAIDIGTGTGTRNVDVANIISNLFNNNDLVYRVSQDSNIQGLIMSSNTPLLNHGWVPKITLEAGVKSLVSQQS